jgi:hypothetical protein
MRFFERLFGSRDDEDEDEAEAEDVAEAGDPWAHHPDAAPEPRASGEVPDTESEDEFYEGFVDRRDDAAAAGGRSGGMLPVLPESTPDHIGDQFEGDSRAPGR